MASVKRRVSRAPPKGSNTMLLVGLMLGVLLGALDQTVVGTSLPKVVADIGGFEHFAWVFSAYMLSSTVAIALAGKFSDLYGRRPVYLTGLLLFLAGSVLCGTAVDMIQLIAYRLVQGIGGGILFPVAMAAVADIYAPAERGRIQGAVSGAFGLASVTGPFIGGWIVDNVFVAGIASWRWVFYVNLPVGFAAIAMVLLYFPRLERTRAPHIDYAGIAAMTLSIVSLLLVMVWGGQTYAWDSVEIAGLAVVSAAAFAAFIFIERRAADPIIPPALFREPIFVVCAVAGFLIGISMFGAISFMPTYMQGVVGISATYSGAVLLPLTLFIVVGATVSGRLMNRFGYKVFTLAGTLVTAVGLFLLSGLGTAPPIWVAVVDMIVVGTGLGFTMPTYIVAAQNAVARPMVGVATSTLTLLRTLGATIGVTMLGALLNRQLDGELPAHIPTVAINGLLANPFIDGHMDRIPSLLLRPEFLSASPPPLVEGIKTAFANSLSVLFIVASAITVAAFAVTVFLKSVPLKSSAEYNGKKAGVGKVPGDQDE